MNNEQTAASSVIWAKSDGLLKHVMPHLVDNMREKRDTICEFSESVSSWPPRIFLCTWLHTAHESKHWGYNYFDSKNDCFFFCKKESHQSAFDSIL